MTCARPRGQCAVRAPRRGAAGWPGRVLCARCERSSPTPAEVERHVCVPAGRFPQAASVMRSRSCSRAVDRPPGQRARACLGAVGALGAPSHVCADRVVLLSALQGEKLPAWGTRSFVVARRLRSALAGACARCRAPVRWGRSAFVSVLDGQWTRLAATCLPSCGCPQPRVTRSANAMSRSDVLFSLRHLFALHDQASTFGHKRAT